MCRPGLTGSIIHQLLCIAVVSTDKQNAVHFLDGIHSLAYALIHRLDGLDGSRLHTGVAHHIRVCKVNDDHIIFSGLNGLNQLLTNHRGAHLRLQIISWNLLGRRNQDPVLALIRLLNAAVKEEGNVGIFLGFCDSGLL